jgi:hypothetical protein
VATGDVEDDLAMPLPVEASSPHLDAMGLQQAPSRIAVAAAHANAAGRGQRGKHVAATEDLGLACPWRDAARGQAAQHQREGLIAVMRVERRAMARPRPTQGTAGHQEVRHRTDTQPRMPQRDRHARAQEREDAVSVIGHGVLAWLQHDVDALDGCPHALVGLGYGSHGLR